MFLADQHSDTLFTDTEDCFKGESVIDLLSYEQGTVPADEHLSADSQSIETTPSIVQADLQLSLHPEENNSQSPTPPALSETLNPLDASVALVPIFLTQ